MAGVALTALDWPRWRAGVRFGAVAVSVAGVASSFTLRGRLGDIDLHFACLCGESLWVVAWHLETLTYFAWQV